MSKPDTPAATGAAPADELRTALIDLLRYTERNECEHGNTHRGGVIWTICDDCGKKWADDKGGFKPYKQSAEIAAAYAALEAAQPASPAPLTADVMFPNVDGKCNCALYPPGALDPCPDHPAALASPQAAPAPDLSKLTDEQIADAVECEFSETGEWPEGDAATFRAILKHAPDVMSFSDAEKGEAS